MDVSRISNILFNETRINENSHPTFNTICIKIHTGHSLCNHYFERAYQQVSTYLDKKFLNEFPLQNSFIQRLWELNLAYLLSKEENVELIKQVYTQAIPDFLVKSNKYACEFYIEATVPTPGINSPNLTKP